MSVALPIKRRLVWSTLLLLGLIMAGGVGGLFLWFSRDDTIAKQPAEEPTDKVILSVPEAAEIAVDDPTLAAENADKAKDPESRPGKSVYFEPVPSALQAIAPENARSVEQLLRWGKGVVQELVWLQDGQILAVGTPTGAYFYDTSTWQEAGSFAADGQVTFSATHHVMAIGLVDGTIQLIDLTTEEERWSVTSHTAPVSDMAFSRDGDTLVSVSDYDGVIQLHDVQTGRKLSTIHVPGFLRIKDITLTTDGKMLITGSGNGNDGAVQLLDVASGEHLTTMPNVTTHIFSIGLSPDDRVLAASTFGELNLWDLHNDALLHKIDTDYSDAIAFSSLSNLVAAGTWGGEIRIWDVETGEPFSTLVGHADGLQALSFNPDGRIVASAGLDGTVRLWDIATGESLRTIDEYGNWISAMELSPDDHTVVFNGPDETVLLWDTSTGQRRSSIATKALALAFSPDSNLISTAADDRQVRLWDTNSGQLLHQLQLSMGAYSTAFSPDNRLVAAGGYQVVWIWDTNSGELTATLEFPESMVNGIAFSPRGESLATNGYREVKLWDTESGKVLKSYFGQSGAGQGIAFSPDGSLLAAANNDTTVQLWDVESGQQRQQLRGHTDWVFDVAFSASGEVLASVSRDGTLRLWNTDNGQLLQTLIGHMGLVSDVAFSSDDSFIVTVGFDGTIRYWGVAKEKETNRNDNRPLASIKPALRTDYYKTAPEMTIDTARNYQAIIRMEGGGEIVLNLFDDLSPNTVNNFVYLANQGYYDGTTFHRVLADFMAQGGDPTGTGSGGPGYMFEDETDNDLTFDRRGLLAMANIGPNTNGSQFFITFAPTPHLDGDHTIFGELVKGDEVLDDLMLRDPANATEPGDVIAEIVIFKR